MKKSLSWRILLPLVLVILVPGAFFALVSGWLTEDILIDHFRQRAINMAQHINEEFYRDYFNPGYEKEGPAFNPLAPEHLKELDELIASNMKFLQVERINFYSMTGQILYSNEKSLVGVDASEVTMIQQALKGEITSKVVYGFRPDRIHGKAGSILNHDVIEVYLPMISLNNQLPQYQQQVGIIELYQHIDVVRQWLNKIRLYLMGMITLVLIFVVVGASSTLHIAALKPIKKMIATITDPHVVVDGKLTRKIEGGTTYELKSLADSFTRMVEDVTEKSRLLNEARELAMVDELTSLYNHRCFHSRLEEELGRAGRYGTHISLMFCDLDGFKSLNDGKGHQAGDRALREISRILRTSKRISDVACRYGGDELALILPDTAGNEALPLAERVRTAVEKRFQGNPEEWGEGLTLSIGIACYPDDAQDKKTLIEKADWAMYYAKRTTKNAVKVFDPTDFADLGPAQPHLRNDRISSLRNLVGSLETDGYFQRHSETVAFYAAKLALEMGLDITEVDQIVVASLLHDIGVIVLPNDILNKEGKLTPEEMEKVKHHPILAVNLLDSLSDVRDVLPIILHHHEKYDGQGYPEKLAGAQIPLGARIVAVADAYNAMCSNRPFRQALNKEEAMAELKRCSGTQFDPQVVDAFLKFMGAEEEEEKKVGRGTETLIAREGKPRSSDNSQREHHSKSPLISPVPMDMET